MTQDANVFYDDTWLKAPLYTANWGTNDSVISFASKVMYSGTKWNESGFKDPEFDSAYLAGGSSGGAIFAALDILPTLPPGSTAVTIICDGGEKYLDTVFDDDWMTHHALLDPGVELHIDAKFGAAGVPTTRPALGHTVTAYA